jgi:nickel transport system substrate-binding protein
MRHSTLLAVLLFPLACRAAGPTEPAPLRVGIQHWLRSNAQQEQYLLPLVYSNHLPKSFVFETLLATDAEGRRVPQLAQSWESTADRRVWTFTLRPHARFHDGGDCDAAAVARYFQGWLCSEDDRFIGACERIEKVEALDSRRVRFTLREPYPLDLDLPLINPMAIAGHGLGRSQEGLERLVGSGPWRIVEHESMQRARYERFEGYDGEQPLLPAFEYRIFACGSERDPVGVWALERGRIDVLIESWRPAIARDEALRLVRKGGFELLREPGSMVQLLCFQLHRGPFAERAWRARLAQAVDRARIVEAAERGLARPVTTLFDPRLEDWPDAAVGLAPAVPATAERVRAELLVLQTDASQVALALELQRQLGPAGIELAIRAASAAERSARIEAGEYDLYVHRTWGAPYDPHATLYDRMGLRVPERARKAGGISSQFVEEPALQELVDRSWREPTAEGRRACYREIQRWIDEQVALVPLYVPDRIALVRSGVHGLRIGPDIYRIDFTHLTADGAPHVR